MIDVHRIAEGHLESDVSLGEHRPAVQARDAARLANVSVDHYKLVKGYGGEKDYEYEARALIAMGSDTIA
jgi:hypothetical protein